MSKFILTGKEWLLVLVVAPLCIFLLAMIDVPIKEWMPFTVFIPEWMHEYAITELILMSGMTILVGVVLGVSIIILVKIWRS